MPPEAVGATADARMGVRLSVPLSVAGLADEISLEPGNIEWACRMAVANAVRAGDLVPNQPVTAVLRPGRARGQHGPVVCLESFEVDLLDQDDICRSIQEFPRSTFATYALARGEHLLASTPRSAGAAPTIVYSLHGHPAETMSMPVPVPRLAEVNLGELREKAIPVGEPEDSWIVTFVAPEVQAGLDEMAERSRASAVEVTGQIDARAGWDPVAKVFVRFLDRLTISTAAIGTSGAVVFTAEAWAEVLAGWDSDAMRIASSVHTHVHLAPRETATGQLPDGGGEGLLAADSPPLMSLFDKMTQFSQFPDPLSAAVIVSVYPRGRTVKLYGYTPDALLQEERGHFILPSADPPPTTTR